MESELHVASEIQKSMLPKVFPPYPERNDIDVYGQLMPAKAVGGDLFDFFIRDEKLFFCIGDVSGKGIPASLVMAVTQTQFRTIAAHEANPDRIMGILNDSLNENNERHMFVTLFIGVLDLPTGRMRYCNAGHDAPVVAGAHDSMLPCDANLPIGVMPGYKFSLQETTIHPSTTVFLYTDGLTEAEDENLQLFGKSRILETINAAPKQPKQLITTMTEAVNHFVGKAEQSDDLTMMAIQYTHQQLDVTYQRSITLPNDIEAVPRLAEFVDEVCEAMSFDPSTAMQINLAIEEAVVNVMNYAYPSGIEGSVTIEAQANEKRLKITITDNGAAFDPTARAEVDTTLPAVQRAIGGLGIHLIRQIMDSINYERVGGMNVLTLRKKLKQDVQE
jgi:sigma-B regulation protein RsbU (phosphoserine phosphatase)